MKEGGWLDKFAPVDKAAAKEYARRQTSLSADNTTPELRKVNRENARKENFISNSPFTQSLAAMSPNHNSIIGRLAAESITEANPLMSAVRLTNSIKDPANNPYGMGKGKGAVQNALGFLGAVGDISDFGNILSPALSNIKRVGKTAKSAIKQSKEALPSYYPDDLFIPDKPYDTKAERIDRVRHAFWNSNRNENNSLSPEDLKVINNNGIGNRQLYTGAPFSNLSTYYVDDLRDIFRSGKRPITPREMAVLNERGVRYESPPAPTIPPMYGLTNGPSNITPSPAGGLFGMTAEQTNAAWADVNNRINTFNWNDLTTSTSLRGRLDQRIQSALGMNTPRNFITSSRPSQSLLQSLGESIYTGLGGSRRSDNQYVPFSQLVAEQNAGRGLFNRSGFTKQQILNSPEFTDKKALSEMSDEDFIHTVFTPSGQVARYESSVAPHLFTGDNEITPLTSIEYADAFNSRLDLLNDIIAKNNKSGVGYRVKGIDSNGKLTFHTPKQIKRWQDDPYKVASIENLEKLKNDPVELQKRLHGEMLTLEDFDGIINSLKEDKIIAPEGESSWNTRINPGEWRGTVENFPNREYYESIPGLKMAGTTSGVFSDGIVRKGSGAYKSVNEYLKTLDLGRVKAGFNSQSKESRGLWESYVKKGTAAGHWGDPFTVHGVMKKNGGWLDKYEDGGELNYNDSSVSSPEGFEGDGYSNVGRDYSPAWGGQFAMGGSLPGSVGFMYARTNDPAPSEGKYAKKTKASAQNGTELESAYAKWPALRNMGPAAVNKDYGLGLGLGYGGVEFMHPDLKEVNYDNGVLLNQSPGKNSTTYNPLTDNEQSVRLDMLHGMHQDPTFSKHRNAFKQSVLSDPNIKGDMDYWYNEDKKKGRAGDGREQWMNNYIDGQMRTLLFEGDRKSRNYSDEEASQLLSNPKIKKNFNKLNNYLKTGYSYGQGPRAQNGTEMEYYQNGLDFKPKTISRDGSQLVKLDQLTNFTNYNTKQPGGWLDKYES